MKRKIQRVFYHIAKFFIGLVVFIDGRLYMKLYNRLLKLCGLRMLGTPRFIAKSAKFDDFNLITVGDRLVVSSKVVFLTHDYSYTTGLIALDEKPETDIGILGPITVGNNVFIGMNSILLPGTTVGDNVIIGAGSVVRGKIPGNVVISGNPAEIVSDIISHINKLKDKDYLRRVDSK